MSTTQRRHEWHFGTYSVLVVGALAAVTMAVAFPYGWYPAVLPASFAALGAAITMWVCRVQRQALNVAVYRGAAWLAFGSWATCTNYMGMSLTLFMVVGGVFLALALTAPIFTPDPEQVPDGVFGGGQLTTGVALDWKRRIDSVCKLTAPGVTITSKDDWPNGTGYTLTVEGAAGSGFTYRVLADELARLGAAARLKPGCALHVTEGEEHQGQAYLNVPTKYDLATTRSYPANYSPLTVNRPIPIGYFPDGSTVEVEVREGSMLVIGRKGGGKTTLLHDITASFARCTDALVWHIDMNAGGMSAPWLLPWLEQQCEFPAIDWFAHDEDEALLMSRVALAIVLQRKKVYQRRMAVANTTLLPLDQDVPEIFIMIDEAAEVLGEDSRCLELGENIRKIMRMGRAVGVNVLISALRPVGDHLPVQVRKNCTVRIGMRVEEKDEYDYTFENSRGCEPHMIKHKGEGFIFRGEVDSTPMKWRSFNMDPAQIAQISMATSDLHPVLDEMSLPREWVDTYNQRWDRSAGYLRDMTGGPRTSDDPISEGSPAGQAQPVATKELTFEDEVLAGLEGLPVADPVRPRQAAAQAAGDGAKLVASIVTEPMMMARIIGEVAAAGRSVTRPTISEWAKEAVDVGLLEKGKKQGLYQPVGWTGPSGEV